MKITQIAAKPQLIKLTLDDDQIKEKYGDALEFWIWDRQPMADFVKLAQMNSSNFAEVIDVINATSNIGMKNIDFASMNRKQNFSTPVSGIPYEYAFDGVDASYDTKVTLYPRPDGVYSIPFSLTVPQATLSLDSTIIAVPDVLVVQNAYARALVERGEDGGLSSSEAYQLYKAMLSDYIALEGTRYPENQEFVAV